MWRSIFQATSNRFLSSIPVGPRHGAPSTGTSVASPRGEEGFYRHFGTGTLPTGTSEPSPRGERPAARSKPGNVLMLLPVFGTATLPTDVSVASSRSHCEFVYRIAALLGFVKFTWHEPLLIIK